MTVSKQAPTDLDLMLYADGELPADEARSVAAWIAAHPDARAKVEAVRQVGEAVRTYVELETDRAEAEVPALADPALLWSRIERRIKSNGASPAEVVEPEPRPTRRHDRIARPDGLWASVKRWFGEHRGHVLTGAVTAAAVAVLMVALRPTERVIERNVAGGGVVGGGTPAALESQPPEVEDLEVHEGSGTILTIEPEGEGDSAAAVIWISHDLEDNTEDPI